MPSFDATWPNDLYALAQTPWYYHLWNDRYALRQSTMPLPNLVQKATVWHYTDGAGLVGIIKSQRLWASSPVALNDSQEIGLGLRLLEERLASRAEGLNDTQLARLESVLTSAIIEAAVPRLFIVSASLEKDLLNQWRGYAGTAGYAVGLSRSQNYAPVSERNAWLIFGREGGRGSEMSVLSDWYVVMYDAEQQRTLLDELVTFALQPAATDEEVLSAALTCIACIKNSGFADEREARLITVGPLEDEVNFRAGANSRVVPFVHVAAGPRHELVMLLFTLHPDQVEGLPISEVVVGPAGQGSQIGARRLLDAFGYNETMLSSSEVSYRE